MQCGFLQIPILAALAQEVLQDHDTDEEHSGVTNFLISSCSALAVPTFAMHLLPMATQILRIRSHTPLFMHCLAHRRNAETGLGSDTRFLRFLRIEYPFGQLYDSNGIGSMGYRAPMSRYTLAQRRASATPACNILQPAALSTPAEVILYISFLSRPISTNLYAHMRTMRHSRSYCSGDCS